MVIVLAKPRCPIRILSAITNNTKQQYQGEARFLATTKHYMAIFLSAPENLHEQLALDSIKVSFYLLLKKEPVMD